MLSLQHTLEFHNNARITNKKSFQTGLHGVPAEPCLSKPSPPFDSILKSIVLTGRFVLIDSNGSKRKENSEFLVKKCRSLEIRWKKIQ
jgi:hypothetical protein